MLGNNQSDSIDPTGIGGRSGKVYGTAVNVEREGMTPATVAVICRDLK